MHTHWSHLANEQPKWIGLAWLGLAVATCEMLENHFLWVQLERMWDNTYRSIYINFISFIFLFKFYILLFLSGYTIHEETAYATCAFVVVSFIFFSYYFTFEMYKQHTIFCCSVCYLWLSYLVLLFIVAICIFFFYLQFTTNSSNKQNQWKQKLMKQYCNYVLSFVVIMSSVQ